MAKTMDFSVLGVSGLKQSGGYLFEEKLAELRGHRGPMLYREMAENSPVIGGVLHAMKTWMAAVPWRVEPAGEHSAEADSWAEFVDSNLQDMSHTWTGVLRESLSLLDYGWALAEIVYKRRSGPSDDPSKNSAFTDGLVGWRKLAFRAQDTLDHWQFDQDQGLRGFWQRPPMGVSFGDLPAFSRGSAFIPIEKCLLFRSQTTNGSPEGKSALRNSVIPYLHARRIEDIEAIGIERDLSGYPVMEVPEDLLVGSGGDPDALAMLTQMQNVVRNVRRDELEGLVIPCEVGQDGKPTGYKFRLLSTGGQRAIDIDKTKRRYSQEMAMSLLAEFILVGMDKGGSYALHDSKTDAFALSLRSILENVADVFNRFGVTRLCKLNGCPPELIPKMRHGDIAAPPLKDISAYVQQLASAGMIMYDAKTEGRLREYGDLPQREESMPAATDKPAGQNAAPIGAARQTPEQEAEASDIPSDEDDDITNIPGRTP
jgi:hypothetical protein